MASLMSEVLFASMRKLIGIEDTSLPYWCDGFPRWYEGTLRQRIPLMDTLGFDLLKQLLRISPSERRAARFLLDHPWFDDVRKDISKFVPWYRGFEEDYTRMMAVDRLPLPRTIRDIAAEEQRLKAAAAAGTVAPAQQRKGAAQSSQGLARGRAAATTAANAPVAAAVVPVE